MARTGATFADVAAEWLGYVEHERGRKASTLADYRSVVNAHLLPALGGKPLERIDTESTARRRRFTRSCERRSTSTTRRCSSLLP
jgi:Phage integrase, N-terminal SAM-like domain